VTHRPTELLTVFLDLGERRKVGRLAAQRGQVMFEYDPAFLASGLQLSPLHLPLRPGVQLARPAPFDGLFGLFNDSLPDGWGRLLLDRAVERHGILRGQLTPLDRLAYVGRQGMGALTYEPDQGSAAADDTPLDLEQIAIDSTAVLAGEANEAVERLLQLNGGSAGARPKVLVSVSSDRKVVAHGPEPMPAGYSQWIIKFPSGTDVAGSGSVEYAYSLMAKAAGLVMPETHLFGRSGRARYFGIQRFDRDGDRRIHMHSLSGMLHADHRLPSLDYDSLLKAVLLLTKDVREVEKAFALACFNVLAHNRDDHSKNVSFLMDAGGTWRLAPAYDLTFSFGPGGEHSMMVMGEGKAPGLAHLRALAAKHAVRTAEEIIDRVVAAVADWANFAEQADVGKPLTKKIERALRGAGGASIQAMAGATAAASAAGPVARPKPTRTRKAQKQPSSK
jgi:serine/threonine-protein kinase HipA